MNIVNLPLEIICEVAIYLTIDDIKSLENTLKYTFPNYIFVPKYKEIFNKSINEISKIMYTINKLGSTRKSIYHNPTENPTENSAADYEVEYYNCDWDNMNFLTANRVGPMYIWDDETYNDAFCGRVDESKQVNVCVGKKLMFHYYEIRH